MRTKNIEKFRKALAKAARILISTHLLPDGDGLGAELALYHYLGKSRGYRSCQVYNPDPLPARYQHLDPDRKALCGPGDSPPWKEFDLWVIVDTNDPRRLGHLWEELSPRAKNIIFLDHHSEMTGDSEVIYPPHARLISDPSSSSIGELLYQLFKKLNLVPLKSEIALGLYVSVMTDTNSFRYARTTPLAHRIAAEMIETGVNPEDVYQSIYSSKQVSHLKLLGVLLQDVHLSPGGKVVWLQMNLSLRKKFHATVDDTQSFLYLLLQIKQAEVICFFREEEDGRIRVSMKSKGRIAIDQLAMKLGGGGHEFAAGVGLKLSLEKAVALVIPQLDKLVRKGKLKK